MTSLIERIEAEMPVGYSLEQDGDGDWILVPPGDVTIFSVPGEGWLVCDSWMVGRDWGRRDHVIAACVEYLAHIKSGDGAKPAAALRAKGVE